MTYLEMMPLASLRIEKELLDEAKLLGLNVSEAARDGIREAIRRKRMLDNIDWLEKHAVKASRSKAPWRARDVLARHDPKLTASENIVRNRRALRAQREDSDAS